MFPRTVGPRSATPICWMELDALVGIHKTNWIWTKGHAAHEDNNRCDWLAQNAARTQTSSWPDGTPHGRLRLDLGRDYVPPKPQAGLFDTPDPGENDEDESDPGLSGQWRPHNELGS